MREVGWRSDTGSPAPRFWGGVSVAYLCRLHRTWGTPLPRIPRFQSSAFTRYVHKKLFGGYYSERVRRPRAKAGDSSLPVTPIVDLASALISISLADLPVLVGVSCLTAGPIRCVRGMTTPVGQFAQFLMGFPRVSGDRVMRRKHIDP